MNHTPMEVMLDEQVEKLKDANADLLEALEYIVHLRPTPGLPADIWAVIFTAIRKAKENKR